MEFSVSWVGKVPLEPSIPILSQKLPADQMEWGQRPYSEAMGNNGYLLGLKDEWHSCLPSNLKSIGYEDMSSKNDKAK